MSPARAIALGPVILDVAGIELTADDRKRLAHPMVGGVILFARNYESPPQLAQLTRDIRVQRQPPLLIAVDQEGGRVQRFRDGFTALPAMRELGAVWDSDPAQAKRLAQSVGYVLATELRAHGVDLSFTPVLDVDHGNSSVIGDRAFHSSPNAITELALGLIHGLALGGMSSVGKHFPGHGHVTADSHREIPVDARPYAAIEASDLQPFRRLIENGLGGIMPAHVVYPDVDTKPAGFSEIWLKQILRQRLGFDGIIFSDDLSMEGASSAAGRPDAARSLRGGHRRGRRAGAAANDDGDRHHGRPVANSRGQRHGSQRDEANRRSHGRGHDQHDRPHAPRHPGDLLAVEGAPCAGA